LRESVRSDDTVCRLGGDEFFVICSRTPLVGAMQMAEDIRHRASELRVIVGSHTWHGSVSSGVAVRGTDMVGPDDLLKVADQGLYVAKRSGRDRVATVCELT
jgi:hemerythrin